MRVVRGLRPLKASRSHTAPPTSPTWSPLTASKWARPERRQSVAPILGQEIAPAEGQCGRHLGASDASRVGPGCSQQIVGESIADGGEKTPITRGLDKAIGSDNEEGTLVVTTNPRKDLDYGARSRKGIRVRRTTDFEAALPRQPELIVALACCHNPDSGAVPPPGIAPPFDDHELCAHGNFAVCDQALEMKDLGGLAEAPTADQSEAGEEPQLVARLTP